MPWGNNERLPVRARRGHETNPQKAVYQLFERGSGTAAFFFQQAGDILIQRKCSPHIMILYYRILMSRK